MSRTVADDCRKRSPRCLAPTPSNRADVRPDVPFGWTDLTIALTLATAFIVLHVAIPGAVPSGADPGGWLAMAKERFGVEVLAATDATYLPGFPVLLGRSWPWQIRCSAITAAGVISKVALVLAIYLAVRPVGLGYAAAAAVMVGMSGATVRCTPGAGSRSSWARLWASSPAFYLIRYVQSRNVRHLAVSAVAVALTLFTHNLVGGLLVGALLLAVVHCLYLTRATGKSGSAGFGRCYTRPPCWCLRWHRLGPRTRSWCPTFAQSE